MYIHYNMTAPSKACVEMADALAGGCLALRVRRLNRRITAIYEQQMREHGVTTAQVNLLAAIVKLGPDRATAAELSRALELEPSTTSRNLDRIEASGWITRMASGEGRSESIRLTRAGQKTLLGVRDGWESAQREAQRGLGAGLARELLKLD